MAKYSFSKLSGLFRKFGGFRLVGAYAKLGVLGTAAKEVLKSIVKRRSADETYYAYEQKIITVLQKRYGDLMRQRLDEYERKGLVHERSNIVWFCWFQGIDNAPDIVKACYCSLKENLPGKDIRIVDESNRKNFVQLPEYIEERRAKAQIPPAMFSDLLRLELLIKYGGTWIDATVFCSSSNCPKDYFNTELFCFQYARPEEKTYRGISNWFITACSNNLVMLTLRDMLYAYWRDFDCVVEYFIFHRFFDILVRERPEVIALMPYGYSRYSQVLLRHWGEPFEQEKWEKVTSQTCFHKLAYQGVDEVKNDANNYYKYIVSSFKELK